MPHPGRPVSVIRLAGVYIVAALAGFLMPLTYLDTSSRSLLIPDDLVVTEAPFWLLDASLLGLFVFGVSFAVAFIALRVGGQPRPHWPSACGYPVGTLVFALWQIRTLAPIGGYGVDWFLYVWWFAPSVAAFAGAVAALVARSRAHPTTVSSGSALPS